MKLLTSPLSAHAVHVLRHPQSSHKYTPVPLFRAWPTEEEEELSGSQFKNSHRLMFEDTIGNMSYCIQPVYKNRVLINKTLTTVHPILFESFSPAQCSQFTRKGLHSPLYGWTGLAQSLCYHYQILFESFSPAQCGQFTRKGLPLYGWTGLAESLCYHYQILFESFFPPQCSQFTRKGLHSSLYHFMAEQDWPSHFVVS